jgi:hypothetical protein
MTNRRRCTDAKVVRIKVADKSLVDDARVRTHDQQISDLFVARRQRLRRL